MDNLKIKIHYLSKSTSLEIVQTDQFPLKKTSLKNDLYKTSDPSRFRRKFCYSTKTRLLQHHSCSREKKMKGNLETFF